MNILDTIGTTFAKTADVAGGILYNVTNHGPNAVMDAAGKAAGAVVGLPHNIAKGSAEALLANIIPKLIRNRNRGNHPDWPRAVAWESRAYDDRMIRGWAYPGRRGSGTVFLLHGFSEHCMCGQVLDVAAPIRDRHGLSLVALDTRHHGRSDNREPTFGTAEMWDLQAAMNWAESNGYPKPFILCGYSLGAMTAGRAAITDPRVSGAFLQSPPAWPWDAIGVTIKPGVVLAGPTINAAYDCWDILRDGDIRSHPATPAHAPLICYAMGDQDHHGIEKTREVYRHWYQGQRGGYERWPGANPEDRTWFITFAGAPHGLSRHSHPRLGELLDAFLNRVLNVATQSGPP